MNADRREHTCVVGLGWGDEGKGKVVDLLSDAFDIVVRYNGGANAGHTVWVGEERFALHLLPAGVLRPGVTGVIGPGVVIDPTAIVQEIDELTARGVEIGSNLKISDRAHLVLPYHKLEDRLSEQRAEEKERLGTTARGIGPCYADKMKRTSAVRVADLFQENGLDERVGRIVADRLATLRCVYGYDGDLSADQVIEELAAARRRLEPFVCETTSYLRRQMSSGRRVLFEGANGMLLDVDHGTYPYVTSSSCGPHGLAGGAGVPASYVSRVIGVTKAYATRVGSGPFVSELRDAAGDRIRAQGNEFGTTTGRPRRCGWFDAVSCRYTARLGGITDLALMHIDTLTGFDEIGVCVAYRCDGATLDAPPSHAHQLERAEPVLEFLPGWPEDVRSVRRFDDLPENTRRYVQRIEALVEVPVSLVSVGPERTQTLVRARLRDLITLGEPSKEECRIANSE